MAIADLKATLSLEFGDYKANLKEAQKAMDDAAKTTKKSVEDIQKTTSNSKSTFSGVSDASKTLFDSIKEGASKTKDAFGSAFNKIADDGDRFKQQQGSLVGTIAKTAAAFVGIKSAADLFTSAIARVDKIQSAEKAIESLTGSNKDAKTVMEGLQKVVDGTPLSLDSFTSSAKGMIAAGMDAESVEPIMRAIGDAAYGVGEGAPSIDFMSAAFKSLQASGTATLGDLNRLMDQNIPVYKILGNQMGMSTADMKKFISDGLLPSGEAMDLLAKGIEEGTDGINGSTSKMAGQMQTAGTTIQGAAGNIRTAFVKSLAVPITASYEKIVNGMIAVKDGIKAMQPQLEAIFSGIAAVIEGVILGIVDTFNMLKPVVSDVIAIMKGIAESFGVTEFSGKDLTEMARTLTPIILGLFAAFKGYVALAKTASTMRNMSMAIKGVEGAMKTLGPAAKLVTLGIKGISTAMSFLAANPIVLVVAAIAAVVAALVYFWKTNEKFRDAIKGIWNKVVSVFNSCIESIKGFIDSAVQFFQNMWQSIKDIWNKVTETISGYVDVIGKVITVGFMAVSEVVKGIMLIIKTAIEFVWNAIVAYYTFIFETLKALFTFAFEILERIVTTVFNKVKDYIVNIWNSITEFFTPYFEALTEVFTTAWEAIKTAVMSVVTPIVEFITSSWNSIKEVTSTVWTAIVETLTAIWASISSTAKSIWDSIKAVMTSIWNSIKQVTMNVWNAIKGFLQNLWNTLKAVIQAEINGIKIIVTTVWNAISSVTSNVWNSIKAVISSIWNNIKSTVSSVANSVKSVVSGVWNSIKTTTSNVWNGIKDAMVKPVQRAKEIISGVIDAIKGFFSGIRLRLPSIEMPALPHFSLNGSFSLNPPSVPHLSVDWYKTGSIFTGPSVIGVGEAGDEAVVPLSNKGRMKPFAQAVSAMIDRDDSSSKQSGADTIIIKENTFIVREEADIDRIAEALHRKAKLERKG